MTKKNIRTYATFLTIGASNTMIDFLFFFFHCLLCSLFSCTVPVLYSRNAEQLCLESKMDVPSKKESGQLGMDQVGHSQRRRVSPHLCCLICHAASGLLIVH